MRVRGRGSATLAGVAAVAISGALTVSVPAPASARGQAQPRLPESQALVDTPQDILRDRHPRGTRRPISGSVLNRLVTAGADPALGSGVSAVVLDAATGTVLYTRNASLSLMPASNEKLVTALTALRTMGPTKTFRTEVRANASFGTVYLVGGGDPALTSAQVRSMAASAKAAVVKAGKTSVYVRVDDDLFPAPTNAAGWKTSYIPGDVAPVRPLVVDGRNLVDTALDAGAVFRDELVRLGVAVPSFARGSTPSGTTTVAATTSPAVSTLVARMINVSNNDYAEFLHRQSSLAAAKGATWAAASTHTLSTLQSGGVKTSGMVVNDGSGLSRSNRSSATALTSVLLTASRSSAINAVLYRSDAMPTAGVSGTLKTRFAQPDTTCARGKVRAKTGTLNDVTALSGTAYGVDGRQRIFAIVSNGPADLAAARFAIERFATAAVGCNRG